MYFRRARHRSPAWGAVCDETDENRSFCHNCNKLMESNSSKSSDCIWRENPTDTHWHDTPRRESKGGGEGAVYLFSMRRSHSLSER
jgi:hypothetical protein